MSETVQQHRFPWWGSAGVLIFAGGLWVLVRDLEVWNVLWYLFAWYGYLLVLDGLIYRLKGRSFLSHRRREAGAMLFWSAPFWFVFEAYNFVIQNWYYVFTLRSVPAEVVFSFLAFATVLPACFVHAEVLTAFGAGEKTRWTPVRITRRIKIFGAVSGLLCVFLPLVLPGYAFWMVWGATLGIPEVVNYRLGAPSLLRDLEGGRPGRLLRLLVGGMWAGLVWEGFNYWTRCKWVYTVPGMEDWKLFEMPVLGFLGFPVLALEAFAFYATLCYAIRGGRHWEEDAGGIPVRPVSRSRYAIATAAALGFSLVVCWGMLNLTVRSKRPVLEELVGLDAQAAAKLRETGIPTPERFYGYVRGAEGGSLTTKTGLEPARLERAFQHAALALHKGMGADAARLLLDAGLTHVTDLIGRDAEGLHTELNRLAQVRDVPPVRAAEVKVWIRAAELHGRSHR